MLGRILCWIGWHWWGYDHGEQKYRSHNTRLVRHFNKHKIYYRCMRCGVEP